MDFSIRFFKSFRRAAILARKRLDYFHYNVKLKQKRGSVYDPVADVYMMQNQQRSMNLLDFNANRDKDLFLIDINSDQTEFGGSSETTLELQKEDDDKDEAYCK